MVFFVQDEISGMSLHFCIHVFVQDEILGMSEKLILKASDLVPLLVENVTWTFGRPLYQEEETAPHKEEFRNIFVCNKKGLNFADVEKEKEKIGETTI